MSVCGRICRRNLRVNETKSKVMKCTEKGWW